MAPIRRAVPGGILQAKDSTTSSSVVANSLKPAVVGSVKDSFKVSKPREENYIPKYDLWAPKEETAPINLMEGDKALLRDYEEEFNTSQLSSPIVSEEEGSDQMRRGSEMDSFNDDIESGTGDLSEGLEEETASIALTEGDNSSVSPESAKEVKSSHHGEESYTSQQSSLKISEEAAFARVGRAGHPTDGGNNTAVDNTSSESNVNSEIKSVNSEEEVPIDINVSQSKPMTSRDYIHNSMQRPGKNTELSDISDAPARSAPINDLVWVPCQESTLQYGPSRPMVATSVSGAYQKPVSISSSTRSSLSLCCSCLCCGYSCSFSKQSQSAPNYRTEKQVEVVGYDI